MGDGDIAPGVLGLRYSKGQLGFLVGTFPVVYPVYGPPDVDHASPHIDILPPQRAHLPDPQPAAEAYHQPQIDERGIRLKP